MHFDCFHKRGQLQSVNKYGLQKNNKVKAELWVRNLQKEDVG